MVMKLDQFEMERMQSTWENRVDYNLSESGVHPLKLNELLRDEEIFELTRVSLGYNQTNGTEELRSIIAQRYPGASAGNILVTNGSAEANFISTWCLIEPGDKIALMLPNYMQIWGIGRAFGADVKPFHLIPTNGRWEVDWDELERAISPGTRLIAVCNPNNPTGAQLNLKHIQTICELAAKTDAWILSDEVYQGAERVGETTPSFWRHHDKVIVVNGLSKVYGLPGLRIGWIVAPPDLIAKLWSYHDYTTICPNPLSDRLARLALSSPNRKRIIERARTIVSNNFAILQAWMEGHDRLFECIPPVAGAIALVSYHLQIKSLDLANRLRQEKSVLVVPGEHFLMENCIRIGFGMESNYLQKALRRVSELLNELPG